MRECCVTFYVSARPARAMVVRLAWHVDDRLGGFHLVAGPCVFSPRSMYVCALAAVCVSVCCVALFECLHVRMCGFAACCLRLCA